MKVLESYKDLLGDKYEEVVNKVKAEISALEDGGAKYVPAYKYKELKDEQDLLKKTIDELKPKATSSEDIKKQFETEKQQLLDTFTKKEQSFKERQLERELSKYKPVSLKALKAELDLSKVEYDDDFNVKGLDEQVKELQEHETLKRLFLTDEKPVVTGTGVKQNAGDYTQAKAVNKPLIY